MLAPLFLITGYTADKRPIAGTTNMMRQLTYAALVAAFICGLTTSAAVDGRTESVPGYSMGVGNLSCGKFLVATASMDWIAPDGKSRTMEWENKSWLPEGAVYEQWLMGYISGAQPKPMDRESLLVAVKKICEDHPDEILASAAGRFVVQRGKYNK